MALTFARFGPVVLAFTVTAPGRLMAADPETMPCGLPAAGNDRAEQGLLYSAAAFEHLRAGSADRTRQAIACLVAARQRLPNSAVVVQDLASAYVRLGRWTEAAEAVAAARDLGAAGPELKLLSAVIDARRGRYAEAMRAAAAEGSWRGDLIAARLGSSAAKDRLLALLPESTTRATWGRMVLSMIESDDGDLPAARQLASSAEQQADQLGLPQLAVSARDLGLRFMSEAGGWQGHLRLRSALEYTTNPGFEASDEAPDGVPLRLALTVEGGVSRSFGRLVASAAARIDQHLFLSQRSDLGQYDIFRWSLAAGLQYPLSADPNGTKIGLVARVLDVFGDRFGEHLGVMVEGGPELHVRVAGNLQARLAFYGQKVDFIDRSPADGLLSPVDRDRVGQRAILTFRYRTRRLDIVGDAMFLRDQAAGEAFDAVGGGLGGRVTAQLNEDLSITGGVTGTLREFGPVGDTGLFGDAVTRTEFRTVFQVGARWALGNRLYAVVQDVLVVTAARDDHKYSDNVLTFGMEAQW